MDIQKNLKKKNKGSAFSINKYNDLPRRYNWSLCLCWIF